MTDLLSKAFELARKLPPEDQDALAALLLAEIESEKRWADAFAKSQDKLSSLAEEAMREHRAGKALPFED